MHTLRQSRRQPQSTQGLSSVVSLEGCLQKLQF